MSEDKIREAKKEVKSLKAKIEKIRENFEEVLLKEYAEDVDPLPPSEIGARIKLEGHIEKIYDLDWGNDSMSLISASQDGRIIVWDAPTESKLEAIPLRNNWVMFTTFSPSMKFIASGGLDNICTIHDLTSANEDEDLPPQIHRELNSHTGYVSDSKFISDQFILSSSGDMSCILWDIESGKKQTEFADHNGDIMSIDISKDGRTFISGACDTLTKLWDVRTNSCELTFEGHISDINSVRYFPDEYSFLSGSDDSTCKLFDIRMGKQIMEYGDDEILCGISSVDFSISGRIFFAGYDDKKVRVWDTLLGVLIDTLDAHENRISSVKVTPDGTGLATSSWDENIYIWA